MKGVLDLFDRACDTHGGGGGGARRKWLRPSAAWQRRMSGLLPEPSGVPDVAESKDVAHPDLRAAMARVELRQAASRVSEANEKCLEEPKEVYEAVFGRWASTHGKVISKRERDASGMNASSRAGKGCEIPNFKGWYLGHFPLVSADFWTSEHLSERSRT